MRLLLLILPLSVSVHVSALALPTLGLHLDSMSGDAWSAQGIAIKIELHAMDTSELVVEIDKLSLPRQAQEIKKLRIVCSKLRIAANSLSCSKALARLSHSLVAPTPFPVAFEYRYEGHITGSFRGLPLANGSLSGRFSWQEPHWSVTAQGTGLGLQDLYTWLGNTFTGVGFKLAGEFDLDLKGRGDKKGIRELAILASTKSGGFSDPSSRHVGEDLGLAATLSAKRLKQDWRFDVELGMKRGQLYLDPLYLEVEVDKPIEVMGSGLWSEKNKRLRLNAFSYQQPDVIQVSGNGEWSTGNGLSLLAGRVDLVSARFPGLYTIYLQPFLIDTVADELQTAGSVNGQFDYRGRDQASLRLNLDDLNLNDDQGRFAINDLEGEINWSSYTASPPTRLSFESANLYRIELGAAKLDFQGAGRHLRLLRPTVMPVFDGELRLASFGMENVATQNMSWHFDAGLTPISMEKLTEAIGWPSMSGKLSGMIPDVSYVGGELIVGGALLLRVFDGNIVVNNLRMGQPLGFVPMLSADVDIAELDLETLTRTFSFGKIQGRLEGRINGLRLIDWQPVQFDARFATPKDDRSRHRISQGAIDDLTSIGGGMAGVLSSGFLRFFEDFSYEQIGLSCRLSNEVCQMDGISPAKKGGYYIVKGKGLPRIDVIGYNHRVDWFELLERLKNIQLEDAPLVR